MNAIRNILDVIDNKITIDLPMIFESKKVEVIILPYNENLSEKKSSLIDFFKNSPFYDSDIVFGRNDDIGRNIEL